MYNCSVFCFHRHDNGKTMTKYQSWEFGFWCCPECYASTCENHTSLPSPWEGRGTWTNNTRRSRGQVPWQQWGWGGVHFQKNTRGDLGVWSVSYLMCPTRWREHFPFWHHQVVFPALSCCINWLYQVVMISIWFSKIIRSQCSSGCWLLTGMIQSSTKHSTW